MTKIYKTKRLRSLSLILTINGKKEHIRFSGGAQVDSTAVFATSDKQIQEVLEKLPAFGHDYFIAEQYGEGIEEKPIAPESKEEKVLPEAFIDSQRFRNLVEMKEALKQAGVKIEEGWNYQQTKKYAFEKGYDYQVIKAER